MALRRTKTKSDIFCPCNISLSGYNINIKQTNGGNQDENIKSKSDIFCPCNNLKPSYNINTRQFCLIKKPIKIGDIHVY